MKRRQKREHLDQVIERIQVIIAAEGASSAYVTIAKADLERLINASIWGDD